jgi:hypothetical protein
MKEVTTRIIRPDIQVAGVFPKGFGLELKLPQKQRSFEQVWRDHESTLRSLVRAWGFLVVQHPADRVASTEFPWRSLYVNEDKLNLPWHTDGRCGKNVTALTQAVGAVPRVPGTAIAPAKIINNALTDASFYVGEDLQEIWDQGYPAPGYDSEMATHLDTAWQFGEGDLSERIIALEKKATARIRHQIHVHFWKGNDGAVILIDNFYDRIEGCNTLHARFLAEEETYAGDEMSVVDL